MYAKVRNANTGSVLVRIPQAKSCDNNNFEFEPVTYLHDIETIGERLFSLAKWSGTSSAVLVPTKNSNYLSGKNE